MQATSAHLLSKIYSVDLWNIYFSDMATYKAIFFCLVQLVIFLTMCRAEQDMEGEILLHVHHSFDLGKTWQDRGIVNIHNTRSGASSHDQVPLFPDQKGALQAQCEVQGLYCTWLSLLSRSLAVRLDYTEAIPQLAACWRLAWWTCSPLTWTGEGSWWVLLLVFSNSLAIGTAR